jgi:hypothetical protein
VEFILEPVGRGGFRGLLEGVEAGGHLPQAVLLASRRPADLHHHEVARHGYSSPCCGSPAASSSPELIRWQPMYHWTDSKIRVHGLTCVMALLYLSLLSRKLHRSGLTMALARAMEAFRGIRRAVYIYPGSRQSIRKLCRLGSAEEELLKALDLEIEAVR